MARAPLVITIGDDTPVDVEVRRSARARRLTLRLATGTGAATLTVPERVSEREIRRFLDAHGGWVANRRAALPPPLVPGAGDRLAVLGHDLLLAAGAGRRPILQDGTLHIPGEGAMFRTRLRAWVQETARAHAAAACTRYAAVLGRPFERLTMRDPRTRWGSCSSGGNLMLSWRLALGPVAVFDYVCAHEVAHLAQMNHSRAFWAEVEALYPNHAAQRKWLHANGADLHRIRFEDLA